VVGQAWIEDFALTITCTRGSHSCRFELVYDGPPVCDRKMAARAGKPVAPVVIAKIGQWPSLTDFQLGDVIDIQDEMSNDQRRELVRAINCSAHGFHVAACVHFRRVFEGVLAEARDAHMEEHGLAVWPEYHSD
jgi:hypothetical protein